MVLAQAYSDKADRAVDPRELRQAQLDAARRAVAIDPLDAGAHSGLAHALGMTGDLAQAKAELGEAIRLNPGHVKVLTAYAGWASTFDEPEKGAEAADRLIRLDPSYPAWTAMGLNYAYYMARRYEDCLRVLARRPDDTLDRQVFVQKAGCLAGLDRIQEAKQAVAKILARYPDVSIEKYSSRTDFVEHERQRNIELMRKAGFPACAKPEELAKFENPIRLPECEAERAKVAAGKS